jgi:hypothetical protein
MLKEFKTNLFSNHFPVRHHHRNATHLRCLWLAFKHISSIIKTQLTPFLKQFNLKIINFIDFKIETI